VPQPLRVDTAELRLNGVRLDALNDATSAQLTKNAAALAACQSGWAGSAFGAFEHVMDTWDRADAARVDRLGDIALNLHRSANLYDHRDQSSAEDIEQTL
jgi:WXG100 family type VII secretion target